MDDKEIKAFKRLLKELGIYHLWLKNRKSYLTICKCSKQKIWDFLYDNDCTFSDIINFSFSWSGTGEACLWKSLNRCQTTYCMSVGCILKNEEAINELKKIIKKHFP